ncbi:MAG TPA: hypothetical protein VK102_06865 [Sphingobacterium sp.]|nr:hypothetical protein [Sphingobacterium sp.]
MDEIAHKIFDISLKKQGQIIIAISGHGASGKTTFAQKLQSLFREEKINHFNTDAYIINPKLRKCTIINYTYRGEKYRYKMTACHPEAHNILVLERDLKMLKNGLNFYTIETPYAASKMIYSHRKITIVEGMSLSFVDPGLLDIKIYFYTDGKTELSRRNNRDVIQRGKDRNFIQQSHEQRRVQYKLYMHPKSKNFDFIIRDSNRGYVIEQEP